MGQCVHHIESYTHNGKIAVLVEFRLEYENTVHDEAFKRSAKQVAMHVTAMAPASVDDLLQQPFVMNTAKSVSQLLSDLSAELRDRIGIARFVRWSSETAEQEPPEPPRAPANIARIGNRNT